MVVSCPSASLRGSGNAPTSRPEGGKRGSMDASAATRLPNGNRLSMEAIQVSLPSVNFSL